MIALAENIPSLTKGISVRHLWRHEGIFFKKVSCISAYTAVDRYFNP